MSCRQCHVQLMDLLEYHSLKDIRCVQCVILECIIAQPCFSLPVKDRQ